MNSDYCTKILDAKLQVASHTLPLMSISLGCAIEVG